MLIVVWDVYFLYFYVLTLDDIIETLRLFPILTEALGGENR